MKYIIGSIKNKKAQDVYIWAKSASTYNKYKTILLVLDPEVDSSFSIIENLGIEVVHIPTEKDSNIDVCKYQRHITVYNYLNSFNPDDIILLTDTLDIVFQDCPLTWYEKNGTKLLVLTSEGISIEKEPWNSSRIRSAFSPFFSRIKNNDIFNGGVILGDVSTIKELNYFVYALASTVPDNNNEGVDQPALNICLASDTFKDRFQFTTSNDNFALHAAVAGPTDQFVPWGFDRNYKYNLPVFSDEGVTNYKGELFCIVHQYNRVRDWDKFFKTKYTIE